MATQKTKQELVDGQATAIQASYSGLSDFSVGSMLLAIVEALANITLWLQALILTILRDSHISTATGEVLDDLIEPFGLTRLPAQGAVGSVTFGRATSTTLVFIPVGATVETLDGTQSFAVIADGTNPAYDAGNSRYNMAIGVSALTVKVQAVVAGAGSNVAPGTIIVITSSVPGVDTVTNALAFTTGANAESDVAYRARFQSFQESRPGGTVASIQNAIQALGVAVRSFVVENESVSGDPEPGFFYVVVDDGTGTPDSGFLDDVTAIVEENNPVNTTFAVIAPELVTANVTLNISVASAYTPSVVKAAVEAAITNYLTNLQLGNDLALASIVAIAFNASPGVTDVPLGSVMINATNDNLVALPKQRIRPGTVTATVV